MALAAGVLLGLALIAAPGDPKYLDDFDFIRDTVAQKGAAVRVRKLDWKAICERFKPHFSQCTSDVEHVKNVMELLATLGDGHTGVTNTKVASEELPRKFDGIAGGGLWWRYDDGKFVVAGFPASVDVHRVPPLGSALLEIKGEPAWLALGRDRARITRWQGTSSDHSLYASLSNALLPFRGENLAQVIVITPDGATKSFDLTRYAPDGKSFDPSAALLPAGMKWQEGAVAGFVPHASKKRIGYLAITGGMDAATVTKVYAAFDALKGMDALVLDARNAGGGGDGQAWEIAGRLYPKGEDNGVQARIEPSGSWQFDGPVVFLQDASMVSSAETLAWAVTEHGRTVSIGRPTGGWGIIPNAFQCPSGLVDFRLGVNARATPVKQIQTEGEGWPPDVLTPPWFAWREPPKEGAAVDPTLDLGLDVAALMACGWPRDAARAAIAELFQGKCDDFPKKLGKVAATAAWFDAADAAKRVKDQIAIDVRQEIALLTGDDVRCGDVASSERRFTAGYARARAAGFAKSADTWKAALAARKTETAAQREYLAALGEAALLEGAAKRAFLAKHGKTAVGRYVSEQR